MLFGLTSLLLSFLFLLSPRCESSQNSLLVMTFNIRYDNPNDGQNTWNNRKQNVVDLINNNFPDIIGMQEVLKNQIDYLDSNLTQFDWFGVGRDDGINTGEFSPIFYRKDRFEFITGSTFWCSQTPESPGLGWDAACNRIVTWGQFKDKITNKTFYLFNTHFDHQGKTARINSAVLLKEKIKEITQNSNVIVTGDFNSYPESEPYKILSGSKNKEIELYDTHTISRNKHSGPEGTFNGFNKGDFINKPIDFIFVSDNVIVTAHATLDINYGGFYPSDHFPVLTKIILN